MSKLILGGGLSGLSAAYYLSKAAPAEKIALVEASNRVGGWVKSSLYDQDVVFEQGPRTIRPKGETGANTLHLIEELGLSHKVRPIPSNHAAARNRLLYANGKLHLLPSSFKGIFQKQEPFSKPLVMFLARDLFARRKVVKDESIYDFVDRRFGREVADYLISPMICGICAGNAKEVSVKFLLKTFFEYEQKHGSIVRGLFREMMSKPKGAGSEDCDLTLRARNEGWNIYSFIGGCEALPLALEERVRDQGVELKLGAICKELQFDTENVSVKLGNNNETITTNHVISALPSHVLSPLVQNQHPNLAALLDNIKYVTVAVVNFHFDKPVLDMDAFGFLVAPKEKLPILGVIYDSCCFPNSNHTVLTVMMGGHWFEEHFGKNPDEGLLLRTALEQLENILGIREKPTQYKVNVLQNCIPQYTVGHSENLEKIDGYVREHRLPLSLCGASYHGVGVNDVIFSAKNAVTGLLQRPSL